MERSPRNARVAVTKAQDLGHLVIMMQRQGERPHHVVEARTQAAARDDTTRNRLGIEVQLPPWSGLFEARRFTLPIRDVASARAQQHPIIVVDESLIGLRQWRRDGG